MLEDEDHIVRQMSAAGVCTVLAKYWDQIPPEVSSDLLDTLFTKLAWDQASADVRVAVIQVPKRSLIAIMIIEELSAKDT